MIQSLADFDVSRSGEADEESMYKIQQITIPAEAWPVLWPRLSLGSSCTLPTGAMRGWCFACSAAAVAERPVLCLLLLDDDVATTGAALAFLGAV